jgi:hypothetical protein
VKRKHPLLIEAERFLRDGNPEAAAELYRIAGESAPNPYTLLTRSEIRGLRELEPEIYAGIQCEGAA